MLVYLCCVGVSVSCWCICVMLVLCLYRALAEKDDLELKKQVAYTHNGLGILCMHSAEYDKVSPAHCSPLSGQF